LIQFIAKVENLINNNKNIDNINKNSGGYEMKKEKPKLFIASSVEGLDYARGVHTELERDCLPTIWNQGIFQPSIGTLEQLEIELEKYDFAVIILTPDDNRLSRGVESCIPRDNLIAELGMFIGKIGRERVFYVISANHEISLPTDFLGITPLEYQERSDDNYQGAVCTPCNQIRKIMKKIGPLQKVKLNKIIDINNIPVYQSNLRIIEPIDNVVYNDWIIVRGTGCPKGWVVLLINEIPKGTFWLQPDYAISDLDGNWTHNKCNTLSRDSDRDVYAIALQRDHIEIVQNIFKDLRNKDSSIQGKNIDEITEKIRSKLNYLIISKPKSIIRKENK